MKLLPEHKKNKKYYITLLLSAYVLYTVSIAIKLVYSAQMVEIGPYFNADKTQLSIGLTIYYIVYSIVQLVVSPFIKKLDLKKFIGLTVTLSAISFSLMMVITSLWQAWLILALNGVLQVGIWGGCMSFFGKYFPDYLMKTVSNVMSTGMAVGTFLAYGFSAFFVAVLSWQYTFLFFGLITIATVVFFYISAKNIENNVETIVFTCKKEQVKNENIDKNKGLLAIKILLFVGLCSLIVTLVYYALTNWVPNLLKEEHGVPSSYSILITLLLPVGIFFGPFLGNSMCQKSNNYFASLIPLLLGASVLMILSIFLYDSHLIIAIALTISILFLIRAAMTIMLTYMPLRLRNIIETGKSSIILNALACISAAVVPFITALIMDAYGWTAFFIFISIIGIVSLLLSIVGAIWAKKKNIFKEN